MDLWNSGEGPEVGVYTCDGGSNQKWDFSGKQLRSEASGTRCLTFGDVHEVWVYTNGDSAELTLNGQSLGKVPVPKYGHAAWSVEWTSGKLQADAFDKNGNMIGSDVRQTTGAPASVRLSVEFPTDGILADKQDAVLIAAEIVDANGLVVPTASDYVQFQVQGPGTILGVGNGDPACHEPDKANGRSAFNGLARVIVQSTDQAGTITVSATSNGLKGSSVTVQTRQPPTRVLTL